jgi:hypothetical protein
MALLRPNYDYQIRSTDKANCEWQWQDPVDDLFESFINPDSFNLTNNPDNEAQRRNLQDDLSYLFDQQTSSTSGSDTIETLPSLDMDVKPIEAFGTAMDLEEDPWSCTSFVPRQNNETAATAAAASPLHRGRRNIYPAPHGRTVSSDCDLLSLELALRSHLLESFAASRSASQQPLTSSPPTPLSVPAKRVTTPHILKKQVLAYATGQIDKPRPGFKRTTSVSPKMMTASSDKDDILARRFGGHAANDAAENATSHGGAHLNLDLPFGDHSQPVTSPTSPATTHFRTENLTDYPFAHVDGSGSSANASSSFLSDPYADEIEPLSPFSSTYHTFPHPNTPVSPTFHEHTFDKAAAVSRSPRNFPAPKFQPTTPVEKLNALLTPPSTGQMPSASWGAAGFQPTSADHSFGSSASPSLDSAAAGTGKAEAWSWTPGVAAQSTAGAAPAPNLLAGLGISGMSGNGLSSGGLMMPMQAHQQPQADVCAFNMMSASPTPSSVAPNLVLNRPPHSPMSLNSSAGIFSSPPPMPASASSPRGMSMQYSMSPGLAQLQQQQSQQQQQQQQQRPPHSIYRRHHHQRHHTVGAPVSTSQIAQLHRSARTPSSSPPPSAPRLHKRSKSSHLSRHKSSGNSRDAPRPASAGFVNFTPDDSKKILTGVAPSGSSKTKARREKEAAERRRKLSEAAKKAVLEAGGDLETLEREGLLVIGEGV